MDYPPIWTPAPGVTLYQADCLEVLPTLAGLQAVITDPPYGMNWDTNTSRFDGGKSAKNCGRHGSGKGQRGWGYWRHMIRRLSWRWICHAVIWDAQCFAPGCQSAPAGSGSKREPMAGDPPGDAELAWCNAIQRKQIIRHLWIGAFRDSRSPANVYLASNAKT